MTLPAEIFKKIEGPLEYGKNDCVQFALAAVEYFKKRPIDVAYSYDSELSAYRLIKSRGGLKNLVSEHLGEPSTEYKKIRRGNVVLAVFAETGEILGVADPPVFWVKCDQGFMPVGLEFIDCYWS